MKVLFAIGNPQTSKSVIEQYGKLYNEEIEFKDVFYFKALLEEVKRDKDYDRIIINEELEQVPSTSLDDVDKFVFNNIDKITDEIDVSKSKIILICSDRRTKSDGLLSKLYGNGIYSILLGDDRSISNLCNVIKKPKTKKEAKEYLRIDYNSSLTTNSDDSDDEVSEDQLVNIRKYFDALGDDTSKYIYNFQKTAEQYTPKQVRVIAAVALPPKVQEVLKASDEFGYLFIGLNSNVQEVPKQQSKVTLLDRLRKGRSNKEEENRKREERRQIAEQQRQEEERIERERQEEMKRLKEQEMRLKEEKKLEEERRKKEEAERKAEELRIKEEREKAEAEAAERRRKEEIEREARRREEEAARRQEEADRLRNEEEAKRRAEEERLKAEHEAQLAALETIKNKTEEDKKNEGAEKARIEAEKRAQNEAERLRLEQEATQKAEEEAARLKAELEAKRKAEEEKLQAELEAKRKAEEDRIKAELEAKRRAEEEKLKAEADAKRREAESLAIAATQVAEESTNYTKTVYEVPKDYKKVIALVGPNKSGNTFIANAIANNISEKQINTALVDMTKDKGIYYIYNKDDYKLRKIALECMKKLSEGVDTFIPASKFLHVYTSIPGTLEENRRNYKHKNLIETVKKNNNLILVDCDFTTPIEYFAQASEIYIVQDLDILKLQETTMFLRELKSRSIDMSKVRVIINKYVKTVLTPKKLIEGLSYYNDPEMSFVDELLSGKVIYTIIPYRIENYANYVEGLYRNNINYQAYTQDFKDAIEQLADQIYPISGTQRHRRRGLFG